MANTKFQESHAQLDKASAVIPLATQTFSKSILNLVVGETPLFLESGKGAYVYDLDGNRFLDLILGLLPVVLGHADNDVNNAIIHQLGKGISFSLATPLEEELASMLCSEIPCAEMVRFGKNGSDATSAAIRLARAVTGREKIICMGYHGWHDWYIGTTTRELGVPKAVSELSVALSFNAPDQIEDVLKNSPNSFAAIILEPDGHERPAPGFLQALRKLCDQYGVILIFDEIVTGFRCDMGGAQKRHSVTPDLACFGKAMGNGMPISALVGRRDIMKSVEDIFFSGTFGGEALSLAASIATINKMNKVGGVDKIHHTGERLLGILNDASRANGLDEHLSFVGPSWLPGIHLSDCGTGDSLLSKSLLRQSLVEHDILCGGGINLCVAHSEKDVLTDIETSWRRALAVFADAVCSHDPESRLRGRKLQPIFQVRR
jgi:glutamate-1-semialdehyde 2,1-aminomutase